MPTDAIKKLVDYLLKSLVALLVGSSGYQALDGRWFGQEIFSSYLKRWHDVDLVGEPVLTSLYSRWGYQSFSASLSTVGPRTILLSMLVALGLLAHILFKPTLSTALKGPSGHSRWMAAYVRYYHGFTLGFFSMLLSSYLLWPVASGLVVLLILLVIPAAGYLLMYSPDVTKGEFLDRFVYACVFLFLLVAIFEWPYQYGARLFELRLDSVNLAVNADDPGLCDNVKLHKGPVFLAYESATEATSRKVMLIRVCFDDKGARFLDFFPYEQTITINGKQSLSLVLTNFQIPVNPVAAKQAVTDVQAQITALVKQ